MTVTETLITSRVETASTLTRLESEIVTLELDSTELQTELAALEQRCLDAGVGTSGTGGEDPDAPRPLTLSLLHADHLGRPMVATDINGATIWDGGITTPFGVQVSTMGAITQSLMFPGQYADPETGLSDNWHRTYDPELGRYLQSDPIGLAGGLNRYAYVGGNPMSWIEPTGEIGLLGAGIGMGLELLTNRCATVQDVLIAGALGAVGGVGLGSVGKKALPAGLSKLSNKNKGQIGEGLSYVKHKLRGNTKMGRNERIFTAPNARRTRNDWRFEGKNGKFHVEAKFGKSKLTNAQKYAQSRLGPEKYKVDYWTYEYFGKVGSGIGDALGGIAGSLFARDKCGC